MKKTSVSRTHSGPRCCVWGKCASCIDNARWERIFQEKYGQQERDYYAERSQPRSSGVSAAAFTDASIYACADEGQASNAKGHEENSIQRFYNQLRKAQVA